jgi:hypothetical protein
MKQLSTLLSLTALLFLTGCDPKIEPTITYEQNLKKKLHLDHVFIPPSDAYPPYTLLYFHPKDGYKQVCSTSSITNLSEEEIKEKLVYKNLANSSTYKGDNTEYNIHLGKEEIAKAGVESKNINLLSISLEKGKIISMPSEHISDAIEIIKTGKCAKDIEGFVYDRPESKFFIPLEVYMYTINYSILDKSGVDITAELSSGLQKLILQDAGVNFDSGEIMNMNGKDLYVGFKGIRYNNGIITKGRPKSNIIDVTALVKEIKEK